ncbi:MAG TPA: hypothetical protein ENI33_06805, partial [Thermoplasmatales archaeon]|nr:hypothetical protein [Thermoplasmatales archaeon]
MWKISAGALFLSTTFLSTTFLSTTFLSTIVLNNIFIFNTVRIGERIWKNRIKGIIVIIFITLLFSGAILINGIRYELEEESFLPKNEVVETNERIIKEYTNEYAVPILVKSKNGNVLQKNDLIEMLEVEKQIYENFSVKSLSIADIISSLILSLNNITDMSYENKIKAVSDVGDTKITQIFDFPFFPEDYISLL